MANLGCPNHLNRFGLEKRQFQPAAFRKHKQRTGTQNRKTDNTEGSFTERIYFFNLLSRTNPKLGHTSQGQRSWPFVPHHPTQSKTLVRYSVNICWKAATNSPLSGKRTGWDAFSIRNIWRSMLRALEFLLPWFSPLSSSPNPNQHPSQYLNWIYAKYTPCWTSRPQTPFMKDRPVSEGCPGERMDENWSVW